MDINSLEKAQLVIAAIEDKKGTDIRLIDVREKSGITDYFVIATGNSPPHLKALVEEVKHRLKQQKISCIGSAGVPESGWLALDYVDVVIHMFLAQTRAYYAIEDLWEAFPRSS